MVSERELQQDAELSLSPEQERVLHLVSQGHNVFFSGPAGTGKSLLLRKIIKKLRRASDCIDGVAVTAPTGIAALNIGGITIHSFAGIGLGKKTEEALAKEIWKSIKLRMRWRTTRVLIIDEISMLDGELFDKLEFIARYMRRSDKVFGGIQLVLSGDFFQLPPVPDHQSQGFEKKIPKYAFQADKWTSCIHRPVFLTKVFRQKSDVFVNILSNMRRGYVSEDDVRILKSLSRRVDYSDGIEPSQLFPRKVDVETCNKNKLAALEGEELAYHAMDSAGYHPNGLPVSRTDATKLLDRVNAPLGLLLKVHAQVMLTKNCKEGRLVNGSIGKVVAFKTVSEAQAENIEVLEKMPGSNKSSSESRQVPFSCIPDDELRPMTGHTFSRSERWPVVYFPSLETQNDRDPHKTIKKEDLFLCVAQEFTVEGPLANVEARRIQVPLILAWALSIHKSQGQTLPRVKIDLGHTFEKGQAYVAISRAMSLEGLELHNFEASKVAAHPQVIKWHQFWESFGEGDWPEEMDEPFMG